MRPWGWVLSRSLNAPLLCDGDHVLSPPSDRYLLPTPSVVLGVSLEVLADDLELSSCRELDPVPGQHPRVRDLAHPAGFRVKSVGRRPGVDHADLLRPDRVPPAVALEHVR